MVIIRKRKRTIILKVYYNLQVLPIVVQKNQALEILITMLN